MVTSNELPSPFLSNILSSVLEVVGLDASRSCEVTCESDESSMVRIYRVIVHGETSEASNQTSFLFKWKPIDASNNKMFHPFNYEIIFYYHVLPVLLRFQQDRTGIEAVTSPYVHTPRCLKCVRDRDNEVLVLEYLEPRSPDETSIEQLQQLGRFHALSLAMQNEDPEGFQRLRNEIGQGVGLDFLDERFKAAWSDIMVLIKENCTLESEYVQKTQRFLDEIYERLEMLTTPDLDEPYNVINYGHYRYGSLALDLSAALVCTKRRMRDDLLRAYHAALADLANQLCSISTPVVPSQAALDILFLKYAQFGVAVAVTRLHNLHKHDRVLQVIKEAVDEGYFEQLVVPCEGACETTRL